ncbi:unnamed protein product, partial [marine sediment metagenome]
MRGLKTEEHLKMDEECVVIKQADNGYIVEEYYYHDDTKDGKKIIRKNVEVIEEKGDIDSERRTLINLFYHIADLLGFHYDRYSKENLRIDFKKKGT